MTKMKKSVLIVDEETMLVDLLVSYLEHEFPDIAFFRAISIPQAQLQMFQRMFDVVITGFFGMDSPGIFLAREITRKSPGTRCIVLGTEAHSLWVHRALDEGVQGFVSKTSPGVEMVNALKAVLQGERYLSPEAAHSFLKLAGSKRESDPLSVLSKRELEVFVHVGQGKSFKTVSGLLNMSVKTVSVHKHNIARKTGIDSSAKIVRYCAEHGLLEKAPLQPLRLLEKPAPETEPPLHPAMPALVRA